MSKPVEEMSDGELQRRAEQAWEMAGLARQDNDRADEERHTKLARMYDAALAERRA